MRCSKLLISSWPLCRLLLFSRSQCFDCCLLALWEKALAASSAVERKSTLVRFMSQRVVNGCKRMQPWTGRSTYKSVYNVCNFNSLISLSFFFCLSAMKHRACSWVTQRMVWPRCQLCTMSRRRRTTQSSYTNSNCCSSSSNSSRSSSSNCSNSN